MCGSAVLCIALSLHVNLASSQNSFKIGELFDRSFHQQSLEFSAATELVNNMSGARCFESMVIPTVLGDPYDTQNRFCDLIQLGHRFIFGPNTQPGLSQVEAMSDKLETLHFFTAPLQSQPNYHYSLSLYPSLGSIGEAVRDLILLYEYDKFVVLYQHTEDFRTIEAIVQTPTSSGDKFNKIIMIRQLEKDNRNKYGPVLKYIKESMFHRIVVHADLNTSMAFLRDTVEQDMFDDYYHYIYTNLDFWTSDLSSYVVDDTLPNITSLRIVSDNVHAYRAIMGLKGSVSYRALFPNGRAYLPTSFAMMVDTLMLLARGMDNLGIMGKNVTPPMICQTSDTWTYGYHLLNNMRNEVMSGTTGEIQFSNSHRSNFTYTIVEYVKSNFKEYGQWNSETGLRVTKNFSQADVRESNTLENKTLRVLVIEEPPFVMPAKDKVAKTGNDRFEGYCVDLLEEISRLLNFNYTIQHVKDGTYGARDDNGEWTGIVGELMKGNADLAVSSMTITYARSKVIDFTVPYMNLGISILFKKPAKKDPSLFSFLSPLSLDVWIYMIAAYLAVSLTLWILARFSPYEWYNPNPCVEDSDIVENQFNLLNSLWFTIGSLMQQGSDIAPRATSTRLVAGVWWLFTLILISSYTANLAAFLTVERMVMPIDSAEDLAKQTKIKYGTLGKGSTMSFFKESNIETYKRMWNFMLSSQPTVFVNDTEAGINRVKNSDYAYLMESSMLEYQIAKDCQLMQINGLLDSKGYGIALQKKSPYREAISSAILRLQENTVTTSLKEKWWKRQNACGGDESKQHSELGLANVGGVFVFLLSGLALAFIVGILEFLYKTSRMEDINSKQALFSQMIKDFRFALRCRGSKKPARRKSAAHISSDPSSKTTVVPAAMLSPTEQSIPSPIISYARSGPESTNSTLHLMSHN